MSFFEPPIPYHHWLPAHKVSGGWYPLYGDFPYYHVSQSVYEALNNGSSPSATNPFATILLVIEKVEESRFKTAWGTVGSIGGYGQRHVNFVSGVADGGIYRGDTNFSFAPSAICSAGDIGATDTDHHSYSTSVTNLTNTGMDIAATTSNLNIGFLHWLIVGR
ncbi:hypothetical protein DRJ25_04450 [Candidatus Woesearchaeota archaeon]|nr:MAG: hypothetical protein DRJ25_04450 [Candidatus Woesearchaeota archaeon]